MRSLLDSFLGVISNDRYKIEVMKTRAPKLAVCTDDWYYITKTYHDCSEGQHSIGLPRSELIKLIDILRNEQAGTDYGQA